MCVGFTNLGLCFLVCNWYMDGGNTANVACPAMCAKYAMTMHLQVDTAKDNSRYLTIQMTVLGFGVSVKRASVTFAKRS